MRQARIFRKEIFAGILTEDEGEYRFCYDSSYLKQDGAKPISLTLPLQEEAFVSTILFPFFDGLIPEGWLLDVALRNTNLKTYDRMSLLLLCCKDCIGAISVVPIINGGDEQ
ncbi:MAG: phosphatidylinositol kinase [Bacteroidales bacterium]|jgi:serine/threonine-protein kinase HipA|nr:phosphatidylinositol kinase [Bacteroidales bacterium]